MFYNAYFMAAICSLASKPGIIEEMLENTKVINDKGIYVVSLYLNGEKKMIAIDDFLPVNPERLETKK